MYFVEMVRWFDPLHKEEKRNANICRQKTIPLNITNRSLDKQREDIQLQK